MVNTPAVLQTRSDILEARRVSRLNGTIVRYLIYGSREGWEMHSRIAGIMSEDVNFDKSQRLHMNRAERYKRALEMTNRVFELSEMLTWTTEEVGLALRLIDEPIPMNLHMLAFEPVFMTQASPELLERYGALIKNKGILGCYLQTELAHGTDVSSLETTATYIPESEEFEIHSPTLTSTKWWIGALAYTSTHGIIQAKLILPTGEDIGPHLFFVQLRSMEDHSVLPGIRLGDIGPKAMGGYIAVDNGFARFNHVRIPRENMLSRFSKVTKNGDYIKPPHDKISYGGMLYIRSTMVASAGWTIAKAATIAIRYATVRRQGGKQSDVDNLERQIITYPSVYYRLLPILSHAYVFILLGRNLNDAFASMSSRLALGDTAMLPEMHAITSGLKVLVSTTSVRDIETARRSMGGHGYSAFAGLSRIYADHLPTATYEGDNFVLDQQVVKAALKVYKTLNLNGLKTPQSIELSPLMRFMRLLSVALPTVSGAASELWGSSEKCVLTLEWRAALVIQERARHNNDPDPSADQRASKAITEAFVAGQVIELIKHVNNILPGREAGVICDIFNLYLLTTVESALTDLLSLGIFPSGGTSDSTRDLRMAINHLCIQLLPEAICLTDVFGFTDWELDSALAVHNGNVYEALWDMSQAEASLTPRSGTLYEGYIKPIVARGLLRSRSKL